MWSRISCTIRELFLAAFKIEEDRQLDMLGLYLKQIHALKQGNIE
jgi:hypothetical protein